MKEITGGVTAAKGYIAAGINCGVRDNGKKDLALIVSGEPAAAAAVYTLNRVKAAPIYVTMENLENGAARAMLCNSGNANACAPGGMENARRMCRAAAAELKIDERDVIVASTGVIGQTLNIEAVEAGMPALVRALSGSGSNDAAEAIMTTDLVKKEMAVEFELLGKTVTIGGIAKGSGMVHPNMGTMLSFITTDVNIAPELLHEALSESVKKTYNRISVDGDTSTNDMACIMANGLSENELIEWKDESYRKFLDALNYVNQYLAKCIARDGEGATKLITCHTAGARSEESAVRLSMSVISSSLVKAAMFGSDANWGRVLCAMGYSKAPFKPEYVDISFKSKAGEILVCRDGAGVDFSEEDAKKILAENEITIEIDAKDGEFEATAWGCDLTYEYVKINGDYRT